MKFPEHLTYTDIERRANSLLTEFGRGAIPPAPIRVQRIAEDHLGLTLFIGDPSEIGQSNNVLGAIFFADNEVFINQKLIPLEGRFNFTLGHEVGHSHMHRDVVDPLTYLQPLLKRPAKAPGVLCRDGDSSSVETQANVFSACLLMPRLLLEDAAHQVAAEQGIWHNGSQFVYSKAEEPQYIGELANRFQVSREAMRLRLNDLMLAVQGLPRQPRFF